MFWYIVTLVTCFKILLIKSYFSTDFEVHRHWLALTYNLPWRNWYTDTTSQWTLDYPPLFAYFEWILSQIAYLFDPKIVTLSEQGYISNSTIIFQRLSVIVSDGVLFYAVFELSRYLTTNPIRKCSQYRARWKSPNTIFQVIVICNMGLIVVDHIHFQYNGLLLGILLLSMSHILNGRHYWASFWFILLVFMKHIFIYMAPVFLVYLLRNHCVVKGVEHVKFKWKRVAILASIVLSVTAISCGPFFMIGQISQLYSRLFPFNRGLTHAYWAPNIWALYNFLDKLLCFIGRKLGFPLAFKVGNLTDGLVKSTGHTILPTVTPMITFVMTILAISPCLYKLWKSPGNPLHFVRALVICTSSAFLFGWHVHEKAILMIIIPHSLLAVTWRKEAEVFSFLSTVGHYSLLPLLFTPQEVILKFLLFGLQTWYVRNQLGELFYVELLSKLEIRYLFGFIGLFIIEIFGYIVFPYWSFYEFLPLMMTSVYCSIGIIYAYLKYYHSFLFSRTNKRVRF